MDPYLNHFTQPDTILPDPYNSQDWDRYAYARNNPVNYTDQSGHFPNCFSCNLFLKGINAVINNIIGSNTSSFGGLLLRGVRKFSSANIVGEGLEQIRNDPDVVEKQQEIINEITDTNSSKVEHVLGVDLGEHGSLWKDMHDPTFWMVNEADLSAENIRISKDGTMKVTWVVSDVFDYHPHWDTFNKRSPKVYLFYNLTAEVIEYWYHDKLGATDVKTSATWEETIYPGHKDLEAR